MKRASFCYGVLLCIGLFFQASPSYGYSASDLKAADGYYAEKSYQMAETGYAKLLEEKASPALTREVIFKWSDCVIKGKDDNNRQKAEKNLHDLADSEEHDRWRAEAEVSLAADDIASYSYNKLADIKNYLDDARDYWAGSSDITRARAEFIRISFMLADFLTSHVGWYAPDVRPIRLGEKEAMPVQPQGNAGLQVLFEEILKIARSDDDKAKAHFGLAMSNMQNYTDAKQKEKTIAEFKTVITDFPKSEWVDQSYYNLGLFYENQADYTNAESNYRALLAHFKVGESKYINEAEQRLKAIVTPTLGVSVGNTFIPDSEITFSLNWRNVKEAGITLYKIDLARELKMVSASPGAQPAGYTSYQEMLKNLVETTGNYQTLPVQQSWKQELEDDGKHVPHSEYKSMADWRKEKDSKEADPKLGKLPAGAYLLVAKAAGSKLAYDLVLVSNMALLNKTTKDMALFVAMDAKTGKPIAGTDIKYLYSHYDENGHNIWEEGHGTTGRDGVLKADLRYATTRNYSQQHNLFAAASAEGGGQAFVQSNYYQPYYNNRGEWWLYAFSDRPAYRPNETVSFKGIVRRYQDGSFTNTGGMKVKARIYDAQGNQVKEGAYTLNDYGAFDDTLTLDDKAVLGEYHMDLYDANNNSRLSTTPLFRLEEYKLPEFIVNVHPEPKDTKEALTAYRLGDSVRISVDAQYYFGGPVADAQVEYLVYQAPYYHQFHPERSYEWYYKDMYPQNNAYGGYGQLLKQEKITTDAEGKAHFTIDTPKDSSNDLQYHIEVRVVDQSRREIRSASDIKVTKNAFFAYLEPKQNLYRRGDKAIVAIKTVTANDQPVSVEGKVRVLRNTWRQPVMETDRAATPGGYNGQDILTKFVKTNDKGEATFEFEPGDDGYYVVEFTGYDNGNDITGQANVFVCDKSSTDIGYRYGGLQIITEKDTYNIGDTARAMIVADNPDSWVLLTAEADDIYDYQMLHVEGSVKLVEIPVRANFTPNVFLNALSADHYQVKSASLQLIVPPADKFLNIRITSSKAVYRPQEEGTFDVTVTDKDGKPVSAEIALGLTDAAVYYIQDELSPDIRQFFYGDKRQQTIQTQTSFYQRPYVHFVRGDNNELLTDDERDRRKRMEHAVNGSESAVLEASQAIGGLGSANKDLKQEGTAANYAGAPASPPAPAAPPPPVASALKAFRMADKTAAADALQSEEAKEMQSDQKAPEPRTDFRSTVIWLASVKTDTEGKATVKARFPDSLTTWRLTVRADTPETAIGTMTHEVKSNKDLMIRLQAPRFFTERDIADVSALIDNLTDKPVTVTPDIKTTGVAVTGLYRSGEFVKGKAGPVEIPAHGQKRVDWAVSAQHAGQAGITVSAGTGRLSDAMEKTYPVIPHGIEKFLAQSAVLKADGEQTKELTITIPKERIRESTSLQLNVSPSLAAGMLDALPYLADYPYGCVEQTMSRFLPAVIVGKTMRDLGISAQDVDTYISDVLEPRGDPKGHPQRRNDATYSRVKQMTSDSLKRLYDFQHADGGWGWWKEDESDRFMTAYVVWGMALAQEAGIEVKKESIVRGAMFIRNHLVDEEDEPDMLAWMLHALAEVDSRSAFEDKQRARLWEMRDKLNPYTRALFAISEQRRGDREHARILAQNLINGIKEDKDNGTAHWGEAGINYRWSEGGVEATAFTIGALSQIDPQSPYLEPAVKWLSLNRRGASWKNTRDTAIAILGLTDYLKASHELAPDYAYSVYVNGKEVRKGHVDASNVFSFGRIIDISAENLHDGDNHVKIMMKGKGSLYASAYAKYFSLEEPITKAGNEIFVSRKYYVQSVKETLMKGLTKDWKELHDGDTVSSGDRIRVDITLDAKNHYEYLLAEDYKPAGTEALEMKSGAGDAVTLDKDGHETGERTPLYQEFRDQKAAFFIAHLKQGRHQIRYELRAEVPGEFHAMPDQAHAMYVPEIRSNSDEMRLNVTDAPPPEGKGR